METWAPPGACPRCAGRDVIALEEDRFLCPWCLYEFAAGLLVLEPGREDRFLADLEAAYPPEA